MLVSVFFHCLGFCTMMKPSEPDNLFSSRLDPRLLYETKYSKMDQVKFVEDSL